MIKLIDFATILQVWQKNLWPNRVSAIESNSAMIYLGGIEGKNMLTTPTFFGYFHDNNLAGVNSGHLCADNSYRSRGLYVFPEYRGMGIGSKLLTATIQQAEVEEATLVWSLPRRTSWNTYRRAGFTQTSDWFKTETSDENAYCAFDLMGKQI
jgi:GNAT superfamily N-acetyltransferase